MDLNSLGIQSGPSLEDTTISQMAFRKNLEQQENDCKARLSMWKDEFFTGAKKRLEFLQTAMNFNSP
jgi:hypothetical protein